MTSSMHTSASNKNDVEILFQDRALVVVHKPADLLVHRSAIDRQENDFLLQRVRDQIKQRVYPVHRLDKPTSGIVVFALDSSIANTLAGEFLEKRVEKEYLAVVRGFTDTLATIDHPLRDDPIPTFQADGTVTRSMRPDQAREAVTHYRTLETIELPIATGRYTTSRYSLVKLKPVTGRRHQLRRHMKHASHPILGDTTHGDGRHNKTLRTHFNARRLMLAATDIGFVHPVSQVPVNIRCSPASTFSDVLVKMGFCRTQIQSPHLARV